MKKLLIALLFLSPVCFSEEQPPYEISDPKTNENFREAFLSIDKLSLLNSLFIYTLDSTNNIFCIDSPTLCVDANNNRVGIGTSTPSFDLDVNGSVSAGTVSASSLTATTQVIIPDGSPATPSIVFQSTTSTGIYRYTAAGNNAIAFIALGQLLYRGGIGGHEWSVNNSAELQLTAAALFPDADNANSTGRSGNRWSEVWAANGTIQTSSSRRKRQIREIRTNKNAVSLQNLNDRDVTVSSYTVTGSSLTVPRGIVYKWKGREGRADDKDLIGFVGDDLPEEARAIKEDGTRDEENFYLSAVVGILSAKIRELEARIEALE